MKVFFLIVVLSVAALSQHIDKQAVFASADTASVSNTDTLTGRWIRIKRVETHLGFSTLYIAADKLSGTQTKELQVQAQIATGISSVGDTLAVDWIQLDSVAVSFLDQTIGSGNLLTAKQISLSTKAPVWEKYYFIRFRFFFKGGTHKTRLLPLFDTI